jgi:hypothetical protein
MECMLASVVLSISVAAISYAVTAGQKQTYSALIDLRAAALAEALLEEVVAHPYVALDTNNVLGPETGETRATFNSADDFAGFAEAAGNLQTATGVLYPAAYQVFSRRVDIVLATVTVPGAAAPVTGLNVTVTVSLGADVRCQLQRFVR